MSLLRNISVGMLSHVPGTAAPLRRRLYRSNVELIYDVALKHLTFIHAELGRLPGSLLELGPGASLGVGVVSALLGVKRYAALDAARCDKWDDPAWLVQQLAEKLINRAPMPYPGGFPSLRSFTDATGFPEWLNEWLRTRPIDGARVAAVRKCFEQLCHSDAGTMGDLTMRYFAPWEDRPDIDELVASEPFEAAMSHGVLNMAREPQNLHRRLARWLGAGAVVTHQVSYASHGFHDIWNGHWKYGDRLWRLMMGRRPFYINRLTHTEHLHAATSSGFDVIRSLTLTRSDGLPRSRLAPRFRRISDEDLQTYGGFMILRRKN